MEYKAVEIIESLAAKNSYNYKAALQQIFATTFVDADVDFLVHKLLYACDVTINFHPDRFSNNGKLIIENLLTDGEYHNQHKTGTSNGALGGNRDDWEKHLFQGAYHNGDIDMADRPKYGALNVHNYLDGATARFGSCFFTVKPHVIRRCTFAFGDSSTNPKVMGTSAQFYGILKAVLHQAHKTGRFVERENFSVQRAVEHILAMQKNCMKEMGGNLDNICIETHIHGKLSLLEDIEGLYVDESYLTSNIGETIRNVAEHYDIELTAIPKRQFRISRLDDENWKWKGEPIARILADRINKKYDCRGLLNAVVIGLAAQDSTLHPEDWLDIGSAYDLFQNFKKIWHYCAYWGVHVSN